MKKFLLSVAAVAMTLPVFAAKWAVVGAYTDPNWNFDASTVLEGEGDELSCTIDKLIPGFKIVDVEAGWDSQLGTSEGVVMDTPVVLEGKIDGKDAPNITFGDNILEVTNAKVTFVVSTSTLTITGEVKKGFPELYATGSFCSWNDPGTGDAVLMTVDEATGIYTGKLNLGESGKVEFKLAGKGWSNEICAPEDGVEVTADAAVAVTKGGKNLTTTLTGEQTLVFNINTMKMTFGDPALTTQEDGINNVAVDNNAEAVYYNLQGVRVANPQGGIFIVKRGNEVSKVLVK